MNAAFRQKVISTLVEDIGLLTGGRFEQFGCRVMPAIRPGQWAERGTTIEGAPRGYTVDTSTEAAERVAEMSSDADYFEGEMSKPKWDMAHALKLHPQVKGLWLLSSREASAGETTKIANLEAEFAASHNGAIEVTILDSRKLAEIIFNVLESDRLVRDLSSYLPSLGRLAEEQSFSHRIPIYAGYKQRQELEQTVLQRIAGASSVVLKGISGIGKSALAAQIAEMLKEQFHLTIWLDARELLDVKDLSDLDVRRTGVHHNIINLLRRHQCLLVLDDANLPYAQIASGDWGDSKVILTCQTSSAPDAITVGDLDTATARAVVEAGTGSCPDSIARQVQASVGGHPLLLRALNQIAIDEGWAAVEACCTDAVSAVEDERHDKVCARILQRHTAALDAELQFVNWCGTARISAELASACVSSRFASNLEKRAFLAATAAGVVRIHDVVYRSIHATIVVSPQRDDTFRRKLDGFIRVEEKRGGFLVRRLARLHSELLLRLLSSYPRPSFLYAIALARTADTSPAVFGDLVVTAKQLASEENWHGREVEVRAVIEAVEAAYTLASANRDLAREALRKNIAALELLLASPAAIGEIRRDLRHHHAKMLERLGENADAESEFRAVLSEHPAFAAARLQLARILKKTERRQDALRECRAILDLHQTDESAVASAVLLESLRLFAQLAPAPEVQLLRPTMVRAVARAHDLDRGHAFQLIASVVQKTNFTMPEFTLELFAAIEWRDSHPATDSERFDWAQAHKSAAKACPLGDPRREEFLLAANDAYLGIESPTSFQRVHHAEALILLRRYDDANRCLEAVEEAARNSFWYQRKTQALNGLLLHSDALNAINQALTEGADKKFHPAFLHDRFVTRTALADPRAVDDLHLAISGLPEGDKFRTQLEAELASLSQKAT